MNTVNTLPKFSEQYSKIIDAYFKDEIKPYHGSFCFCGTLCDNRSEWMGGFENHNDFGNYFGFEYVRMENALLHTLCIGDNGETVVGSSERNYENRLFRAMSAALDVLRTIHEEHGEIIDQTPVFKKRELVSI